MIVLAVVAIVAAVAGDSVSYEIGRRVGPSLREGRLGRWVGPQRWERAEAAVHHRGATAVVVGRWVGVLRAQVPATAGAARMPYPRFLVAKLVGGGRWARLVIGLGFSAGSAWQQVQGWLGLFNLLGRAAVAAGVSLAWLKRRRRRTASNRTPGLAGSRPWRPAAPEQSGLPRTSVLDTSEFPVSASLDADRGLS